MPSMKFADILLENNPRSVTYPGMYCRSDQPVIQDSMSGEWKLSNAGTFDFTTYFNSLSVEKLLRYTKATGFALHLELKGAACTVTETYGDTFSMHSQLVESASRSLPAS
ncbi:MAG: glycosyltransferase family 2 protein, partial [Parascardovia denticolens]